MGFGSIMKEKNLESRLLGIIFCLSYTSSKKHIGKNCKWMRFPFALRAYLRPAFHQRNLEQPHGFPCLSSQGICNAAQKSWSILHFCPYPLLFLTHSLPVSHYGTIREIGISTFGLSSCAHTCMQVYFLLRIHQSEMVQKLLKKNHDL